MSGKSMLYELRRLLSEHSSSAFFTNYLSYRFLWEAAIELGVRSGFPRGTASLTTVASQAAYDLPPSFAGLYQRNKDNQYFVIYNDGTRNYFTPIREYDEIVLMDQSAETADIPSHFSLKPKETAETQVTGVASANGAASAGECTLTVAAAAFSNVNPGDSVENSTDGASGIVLERTSNLALKTALFEGSGNDWATNDAFVIQPNPRMQLVLNPPPTTAGHTVSVPYVKVPDPVFSENRVYMFPFVHEPLLTKYAAWLYKYKDSDPNYGDKWYMAFDTGAKKIINRVSDGLKSKQIKVNFKARR
jgi:hypothetical protein